MIIYFISFVSPFLCMALCRSHLLSDLNPSWETRTAWSSRTGSNPNLNVKSMTFTQTHIIFQKFQNRFFFKLFSPYYKQFASLLLSQDKSDDIIKGLIDVSPTCVETDPDPACGPQTLHPGGEWMVRQLSPFTCIEVIEPAVYACSM